MRHFFLAAPLVVAIGLVSTAQAQLNELNVKGKVLEVSPLVIALQTDDGVTWYAGIDPKRIEDGVNYMGIPEPKIEVSGTEAADVLRPGMIVRFTADVERKKLIKIPVEDLTVIGPNKNDVHGLLPEGGAAPSEGKDADTERMTVIGPLTAASRGAITVGLPDNKSIKAKLSPEAVVKIAASDIQLIRPGDEIEVKGFYGKAPRVFATVVNVKRVAKADKGPRKPASTGRKPDATAGKKPKESDLPAFGEGDPRDAKPDEKPAADKPGDKPVAKPSGPVKATTPGKILKVN